MPVTVIRAAERSVTTTDWLSSRHSFSFGDHYDPDNTHHGVLLTHNDETLAPGAGFDFHRHQETEILTWVVEGALRHRDCAGHTGVVRPGMAQRMTAGTGVEHSEVNNSATDTVRYIQMWVAPDTYELTPSYEQQDVSAQLAAGGLVTVASGDPDRPGAVSLANRGAALQVARLAADTSVRIPAARFTHLFVVAGRVELLEHSLDSGDSLRGSDTAEFTVTAEVAAEILVWSMRSALGER